MVRGRTAALLALLVLPSFPPAARASAQAAEPFPVVAVEPREPRRHLWAYAALTGGVALGALSFVFSERADQAYADYLASTDQVQIQVLYDRAVHNDHLAQGSLLTGEALVATGLYLRFIRQPRPHRVSLVVEPSRCALAWRF